MREKKKPMLATKMKQASQGTESKINKEYHLLSFATLVKIVVEPSRPSCRPSPLHGDMVFPPSIDVRNINKCCGEFLVSICMLPHKGWYDRHDHISSNSDEGRSVNPYLAARFHDFIICPRKEGNRRGGLFIGTHVSCESS